MAACLLQTPAAGLLSTQDRAGDAGRGMVDFAIHPQTFHIKKCTYLIDLYLHSLNGTRVALQEPSTSQCKLKKETAMAPSTASNPVLSALLCIGLLVASRIAVADEDHVVRHYTFDLSDIYELELCGSVGTMRIESTDSNELELVLEIEGNRDGFFRGRKDVSGVELQVRERGDRLVLEQTEEDTETDWTIYLPVVARTVIEFGVGEVDAEIGATDLEVDVGVGDVDVVAPQGAAGFIDLLVGVGDARMQGGRIVDADRAFISRDIRGRGEGEHEISIKVGVGDLDLRLR
jgi:hypothetical protein